MEAEDINMEGQGRSFCFTFFTQFSFLYISWFNARKEGDPKIGIFLYTVVDDYIHTMKTPFFIKVFRKLFRIQSLQLIKEKLF